MVIDGKSCEESKQEAGREKTGELFDAVLGKDPLRGDI